MNNLITNNFNWSTFKNEVYKTIKLDERLKKVNVVKNLAIGSINIDLAFYYQSVNNIELLIILDDWKKNIDIQSWFEDIDSEEYLKSRNYSLMRIREQDWLKDKEYIIQKIINRLSLNTNVELKTQTKNKKIKKVGK